MRSVRRTPGQRARAAFADDLTIPNLIEASVLRSPLAHARMITVDTAAARALPGVVDVVTIEDLTRNGHARTPPSRAEVHYVGEPIAVVGAEQADLARKAVEVLQAELEPLAVLADAVAAAQAGETADETVLEGEVSATFAEADCVVAGHWSVPAPLPLSIEPRTVVTWLDEDGRLVVRSSSEAPFALRLELATRLGLPIGQLRVVQPRLVGVAGARGVLGQEDLAAALTLRTGRPVRLAETHGEFLSAGPRGPSWEVELRLAVKDGVLAAVDLDLTAEVGWVESLSEWKRRLALAVEEALSAYRLERRRFTLRVARTHAVPATWPTALPVSIALEGALDEAARRFGVDPLALRFQHAPAAALALDAVASSLRGAPLPGGNALRGVGYAVIRHVPTEGVAGARIELHEDGSFALVTTPCDLGTIAEPAIVEETARLLGVSADRIVVSSGQLDTDATPWDPGPRPPSAWALEQAVLRAARSLTEAPPREEGGPRPRTMATGTCASGECGPLMGAVGAEVLLDPETGLVRLVRLVQAFDLGPVRQRALLETRAQGLALRAVGLALWEPAIERPARSLRELGLPTALDAPPMTTLFLGTEGEGSAFGRAGLGEAPLVAAAAVANAVAAAAGCPIRCLPSTPPRTLRALRGPSPSDD